MKLVEELKKIGFLVVIGSVSCLKEEDKLVDKISSKKEKGKTKVNQQLHYNKTTTYR